MAAAVYLLCALASTACAALLLRQHRRTRANLLFWSSVGFCGLALNNVLLFLDYVVIADVSLLLARNVVALASLMILVFGFIWSTR